MNDNRHWIWQDPRWPQFFWQEELIAPLLRHIRLQQGILLGKIGSTSEEFTLETTLEALLQNIITSSAIEGELLNAQSLRSSLAKRLGLSLKHPPSTSPRSEGLVNIMMDAITSKNAPLTLKRLLQWHQFMFPNQEASFHSIRVGQLRGEDTMQVVSGRIDNPRVHFEAPPKSILKKELDQFIKWFNKSHIDKKFDPILRAAICHFWFVTIHPFEDGNGRMTRVLTDLALAQNDNQSIRLYTMSATILEKRNEYYKILEKSQRNSLDITKWLVWFLEILEESINKAINKIEWTLIKGKFWQDYKQLELSKEQIKVLNWLLGEGDKEFTAGISANQYQKIAKVSKATATRHLTDLIEKGCLEKLPAGGRSTRYQIKLRTTSKK